MQQEVSRVAAETQRKNDWGYSRNVRGAQQAQQGCNRNAAKTTGGAARTQQETITRIRQGCSKNETKTTGAAAGTQQEFGRSAAGMQRKRMHGATADT